MVHMALPAKLLRLKAEGFVFLAGFSMMAVELLAAKVTSPYIGSSLYTWTSIIGVILLGVTVGAWVGGYLADRFRPSLIIAWAFILGGGCIALAYVTAGWIGPHLVIQNWPLWFMSLAFALTVFLPPAMCLSAIQPASVKFHLSGLDTAATVYGTLGAWNAVGSVLGVFVAGYLFEGYLSIRLVWFLIALLLVICGALFYVRHRLPR